MAGIPTNSPPGSIGRSRAQPPAANYPQLQNTHIQANGSLPPALTQAIQQSFETTYAVRDQTTANSDAINHMVLYGTWQDRSNTAPTALPDGALWYLTDYRNGVYQVRVDKKSNQLAWFWATGVVWEAAGVALAPINLRLGLNDAGFMVATGGHQLIVWNGTAWTSIIQGT